MSTLKLLTWNIWMMPSWTGESPKNTARAAAIASELLARDFDIVCLEKAFDGDARAVLAKSLGARYPYRYGPVNKSALFKLNGGVWVLSRWPLSEYREIEYDDSTGVESFSAKGAMLLHGCVDGHHFQLAATHLQGDDTPGYNAKHQAIRNKQMTQMASKLVSHADAALPLFVCGDFCTPRRDPADPFAESAGYKHMLGSFGAVNGPDERITLDDRRVHNDLANDDTGRVAELDYVLLRDPTRRVQGVWQRIVFRHQGWDGANGRKDLSYRYAVGASFVLP